MEKMMQKLGVRTLQTNIFVSILTVCTFQSTVLRCHTLCENVCVEIMLTILNITRMKNINN